jgi:ABC-type transport system involved in cytochrome bd biosynthesis fused ATPase/permease subunit
MFSYKILPLALLISIPLVAMDKQLTPAAQEDLGSTLLARRQLTNAVDELTDIRKQVAELKEKEKIAAGNANTFVQKLEEKYNKKCDAVCSLDSLKLEDTKKVKVAESAKLAALEVLLKEYDKTKDSLEKQLHDAEIKYTKDKTAKEKEHDTIINALAATLTQRTSEIETATKNRDEVYADLTKARAGELQEKTGLFGIGFLGL